VFKYVQQGLQKWRFYGKVAILGPLGDLRFGEIIFAIKIVVIFEHF